MSFSIQNTSPTIYLGEASILLRVKIIDMQDADSKELDGIGARFLHARQLIITLIALPVLFLTGALEAIFRAATCQFSETVEVLHFTGMALTAHLCLILPLALTGTFATPQLAKQLEEIMSPCTETLEQMWTCSKN